MSIKKKTKGLDEKLGAKYIVSKTARYIATTHHCELDASVEISGALFVVFMIRSDIVLGQD